MVTDLSFEAMLGNTYDTVAPLFMGMMNISTVFMQLKFPTQPMAKVLYQCVLVLAFAILRNWLGRAEEDGPSFSLDDLLDYCLGLPSRAQIAAREAADWRRMYAQLQRHYKEKGQKEDQKVKTLYRRRDVHGANKEEEGKSTASLESVVMKAARPPVNIASEDESEMEATTTGLGDVRLGPVLSKQAVGEAVGIASRSVPHHGHQHGAMYHLMKAMEILMGRLKSLFTAELLESLSFWAFLTTVDGAFGGRSYVFGLALTATMLILGLLLPYYDLLMVGTVFIVNCWRFLESARYQGGRPAVPLVFPSVPDSFVSTEPRVSLDTDAAVIAERDLRKDVPAGRTLPLYFERQNDGAQLPLSKPQLSGPSTSALESRGSMATMQTGRPVDSSNPSTGLADYPMKANLGLPRLEDQSIVNFEKLMGVEPPSHLPMPSVL